ncbi:MAG TPA: type II secretion system protein [Thermoleophilaceae bacterium]|nr:type II secretion system protein [Thermoleophilaceae bacterium]
MRRLTQERGFTIVEMMVAVVVLLIGALGTLAMLDTASKQSRNASDRQNATALARQVLEEAKGIPYRDLAPGSVVTRMRENPALAGASASPWRIERDNTVFTVQVQVCWLDEPADGLGSRASGNFCAGEGSGGSVDGNSIDHKRVTVSVTWSNSSGRGTSRQSTLVSARGGIDAPGVSAVEMSSPSASPITDPLAASASFVATTTEGASAVVWSLDGAQQDAATGDGTSWAFGWELPTVDGVYDVSAQAFDAAGLGGEVRSVTVVINRFAPLAPQDMVAARNNGLVETQWSANRERDVIGYRVYRQEATGAAEVVCDFTTAPKCVDQTPPVQTGQPLEYWAVAIDRDTLDQQREGDPSERVNVNTANTPPNEPLSLTLAKDAVGNTILQWTAAALPDADGDAIQSYVIYRDGTAIADRYDQVAGTEMTMTDHETNGVTHEYWVSAVDARFAESTPLGPVSG